MIKDKISAAWTISLLRNLFDGMLASLYPTKQIMLWTPLRRPADGVEGGLPSSPLVSALFLAHDYVAGKQ